VDSAAPDVLLWAALRTLVIPIAPLQRASHFIIIQIRDMLLRKAFRKASEFTRAVLVILATAASIAAQHSIVPPTFEAASVKQAKPQGNFNPPSRRATPIRLEYRNYSLVRLIAEAWNLADYQIQAPDWAGRERYDISATKPRQTSVPDTRRMLQSLLIERFHLETRPGTKDMPVYHLLPEKVALLRPEHDEPDVPGCQSFGTLGEFAQLLSRNLNAPVVDNTNIAGTYYFILAYRSTLPAPERSSVMAPPPPTASTPPPCPGWSSATMPPLADDIFEAARKQMGLKLERRGRASVSTLAVDRADRVPKPN
jgi:uncharacterized protein (TIGR03435 family)